VGVAEELCECGELFLASPYSVKKGTTSGCSACKKQKVSERFKTHGDSKTRLFKIWQGIKNRCFNVKSSAYKYYGAKGITMEKEWINDFSTFKDWALSSGYTDKLTIDKDILSRKLGLEKKKYSPETCCWVTRSENSRDSNIHRTHKKWSKARVQERKDWYKANPSLSRKKVYQFSMEGEFISSYDSVAIAKKETKATKISEVCTGKRTTSGGYKWSYDEPVKLPTTW
jgi:hypothetical protein